MLLLTRPLFPRLLATLLLCTLLTACGASAIPSQPLLPTASPPRTQNNQTRAASPSAATATALATKPPAPTGTSTATATAVPAAPANVATPATSPTTTVTETPGRELAGFEVLDPTGRHAGRAARVRTILPEVLAYLEERTGYTLEPPVTIVVASIREGDACAVRGLALPSASQVYLYVGRKTAPSFLGTALSHELAHILQAQVAGGSVTSSTLAEGFAVYAQGRYWPQYDPDTGFQQAVRRYREQNMYIPLTTQEIPCDTDTRDRIYTERAAFLEWLLATYGEEKFWELNRLSAEPLENDLQKGELPYVTPPTLRANPSYENAPWEEVYGRGLAALERTWLRSLQ